MRGAIPRTIFLLVASAAGFSFADLSADDVVAGECEQRDPIGACRLLDVSLYRLLANPERYDGDLLPARVAKMVERFPVRLTEGRSRDEAQAIHDGTDHWVSEGV